MKRPARPCSTPNCPGRALTGPRCPACTTTHTKERDTHWNRKHGNTYHTTEYRKARAHCLARWHHQCAVCSTPTSLTSHHLNHVDTDHRASNLVCLCTSCHMRIEAEHQRGQHHGTMHTALARALDTITSD